MRPGAGPRLPYRDFPVEYPPLALAAMALPRLLASTLAGYRVAFAAMIALLYLVLCWIAGRLAGLLAGAPPPEVVWRRMALLALAVGPLLVQRFDLVPAALVAGAVLALSSRRDGLAGALLGLGIMTKLYPALLLGPIAAFLLAAGAPQAGGGA